MKPKINFGIRKTLSHNYSHRCISILLGWCNALEAQLMSAEEVRGRLVEPRKGKMSVLDRAFKGEL